MNQVIDRRWDNRVENILGEGGRMTCPSCGSSTYIWRPLDNKVLCTCGWCGDYDEMLFLKKVSKRCKERLRRI